MKTQELKIVPPKGYEIDWENSSVDTIRFKPIKEKITYQDIINNIKAKNIGVSVQFGLTKIGTDCFITSEKQLEQLLALNKLMNVAKYLNGDWEPDFTNVNQYKYMYIYDYLTSKIEVQYNLYRVYLSVCFKTKDLALQAIEILGEEEVKKALGIFE